MVNLSINQGERIHLEKLIKIIEQRSESEFKMSPKNTSSKNVNPIEVKMYDHLSNIANQSKSKKITSSEFEKFAFALDDNSRSNVLLKLTENGLITKTSKCDSIFLQHLKRHIDENLLSSLLEKGSYTIKIDKQEWLDKIVVDPQNNES